jgi:hypothetical protein
MSELTRGCGGVAILWKKEERMPCPENGQMCGIKVQLGKEVCLTIVGVYLPSDGYNEDYKSCLIDLEEVLSSLSTS